MKSKFILIFLLGVIVGAMALFLFKDCSSRYSQKSSTPQTMPISQEANMADKNEGQISVTTHPPKAQVFIDHQPLGASPLTIKRVRRDKTYSLQVKLEGYKTWSENFDLKTDSQKKFEIDLVKEKIP